MVFVLVVIVTMNFNDHWSTIDATPSTPVVKRVETVDARSRSRLGRAGAGSLRYRLDTVHPPAAAPTCHPTAC